MAVAHRLLEAIEPVIAESRDVTLDLSRLTFVDSSGIRAFIEAGLLAAAHHRSLVLRSPSRIALSVLEIVGAEYLAGIEITEVSVSAFRSHPPVDGDASLAQI